MAARRKAETRTQTGRAPVCHKDSRCLDSRGLAGGRCEEWLPLLPPGPQEFSKKAVLGWGGGGDGDLEVGGNLEIDSQNQGWKGFREAFGLFPAFGQNLGLSISFSISDKDSQSRSHGPKGLHRVPESPDIMSRILSV